MSFETDSRGTKWTIAWLLLCASAGCNAGTERTPGDDVHGYHGGHTFKMPAGANLQLELTLDEKRRRLVIYGQDSDSHQPIALEVDTLRARFESDGFDFETAFSADPRSSDTKGQSSRFALSLDSLPQQLLAANRFVLTVWYPSQGETISVSIVHRNDHSHTYRHD